MSAMLAVNHEHMDKIDVWKWRFIDEPESYAVPLNIWK